MSKIISLLALGICSMFVFSCEEIPPTITSCQTDRVVLVEEFTGVSCVNCPAGTVKLEQISAQNPGKVIVVAIHAGGFAVPSSSSNYLDLRCQDGEDIASLLGATFNPAASINRTIFEGKSDEIATLSEWAGFIGSELCNRPIAELEIVSTYNTQDSMATVTVDVLPNEFYTDGLPEDLALTIMITESNIIDYQLDQSGWVPDYVHKHVLRDVLSSNFDGDVIISKGSGLSPQQKVVTDYKIPAEWNPDNCHVVAFIHNKGTANRSVLQVKDADLHN